jgi:glycosyltransferase involved in cell wall biosynthesis
MIDALSAEPLRFTVVVPTFNRPRLLRQCLIALSHLDYPADQYEIVIVDDGSRQPIDSIVASVPLAAKVTVLCLSNGGPARARNAGARIAQGAMLAFTDDDCGPAPAWLKALDRAAEAQPGAMLGGRTLNALPHNDYSSASHALHEFVYEYFNHAPRECHGALPVRRWAEDRLSFASNNLAVPTRQFLNMEGFDEAFDRAAQEDRDLCERWRELGLSLMYVPKAEVHHAHWLNLSKYLHQHYSYGRGAYLYHTRRMGRTGQFIEPEWRFYRDLLISPWRMKQRMPAHWLATLLALALAANTVGHLITALRRAGRWTTASPSDQAP